jgi:Flp pilus assembly pilin Flp
VAEALKAFWRDEGGINLLEMLVILVFVGIAAAWIIGSQMKQRAGQTVGGMTEQMNTQVQQGWKTQ